MELICYEQLKKDVDEAFEGSEAYLRCRLHTACKMITGSQSVFDGGRDRHESQKKRQVEPAFVS